MHQFGWLSERGGNFFYFLQILQKEGGKKGGGVLTLEETMRKNADIKKSTYAMTLPAKVH